MLLSAGGAQSFTSVLAIWTAFSSIGGVLAGPVERRQESTSSTTTTTASSSSPSPTTTSVSPSNDPPAWVSLSNGKPVSTITPQVTTVDGKATTVNAQPPTSTDATSTGSSGSPATPDGPTATGGAFPACRGPTGPFAPFCQPANGTDVYVGDTYYVTWDPKAFGKKSTVVVALNYVDSEGGGSQAWQSPKTENEFGFVAVTMADDWRSDKARNNLTFSLVALDPDAEGRAKNIAGMFVSLVKKPVKHLPSSPPTPPPKKLALMVGLPVALGAVVLIVCGLFVAMRKTRRVGLGNVMGRRRGYGVGKSRRQRVRSGKKGGGAIRLGEDGAALPVDAEFEDEPSRGVELAQRPAGGDTAPARHGRDDDLGSLVGSPTDEDFGDDERPGGNSRKNAFRDEVERQRGRRQ
ncbi:MAG: hypothetical protein M1832_001714 [Thelocarpon impressellum]|nr:MAG: hypothetical protein M1832_001714 [Thelocarpon impressellum]